MAGTNETKEQADVQAKADADAKKKAEAAKAKAAAAAKKKTAAKSNTGANAKDEKKDLVTVKASRDGFRRAGRAWSKEGTTIERSELTDAEWKAVRAEPMLTVSD